MKNTLSALAIATLATIIPAHAAVISANFTGTVSQTQGATGVGVGSTTSGHFDVDTSTGMFLDFTIGGQSAAAGYQSSATFSLGGFDAIYTDQLSPVSAGGTSNRSFTLDLSSLTSWPSSDTAYTLLLDKSQLTSNLDTIGNSLSAIPSTFGYYTANADGTNVVSLRANLTSIVTAAAVPEPATFTLLASSLACLAMFSSRRRV